jgi:serine/threonine protein kinase
MSVVCFKLAHIVRTAKDLIRHLLRKDPKERFTAKQFLEHRWVKGIEASEERVELKYERFRQFNTERKAMFQRAYST